mmetsp:Transcript_17499/g.29471  ORF Transcript_17499/g.29471 Transcript_17499/m.29471 type:complete len:555 (-) Transcript_17499:282-1946(-)
MYQDAQKVLQQIENPDYADRILQLQIAIQYELEEIQHAKSLISQMPSESPEAVVAEGCMLYKEEKFEEAKNKFQDALNMTGYQCDIAYNIALCYYKLKQLAPSLKHIADIIEKGVREHPELGVGSNSDGVEVKSVGNTQVLRETALIEAFNLKAAIEFQMKNTSAAREALLDMPPRNEEELDPVTLHNQALMNIEQDPTTGFKKLNFLLNNPPFPPETFPNLILLYCKYQHYDLAADVLAENADLTYKCLSTEDFEFLETFILYQSSQEEAFAKFEQLANRHIDSLRKKTKSIQDARIARDSRAITTALQEYDTALDQYIPVLMMQAKVYWDKGNYAQVEKIFRQSAEFCSEHETWKLNVAHVFFMQDNKYRDAIRYYEPFVRRQMDDLLSITAIVLANLCVSYIMTSQNADAEELMKCVEKEEDRIAIEEPQKQVFHLCIVNLVIGTLYCAKGNYNFGVSRIVKSLEPFQKKLGTDTWFYAKRCLLSLIETLAKHMLVLPDSSYNEILNFLDAVEIHGKNVKTVIDPLEEQNEKKSAAYEAKLIKKIVLKLRD